MFPLGGGPGRHSPANMRRSDKETWGIYFTTDQQGEKGEWEGKWDRDEERGIKEESKLLKETERERDRGKGRRIGWRTEGGYTIL